MPDMSAFTTDHMREMTGMEFLTALAEGKLPPPPMAKLMNMTISEVSEGRVVFTGEPGPDHLNPFGLVHGGYAATLLDSAMTCAAQTTLKRGWAGTTMEFKINFIRPIMYDTGLVRAIGTLINSGRTTAIAEGRIFDAKDRLMVYATTTCIQFPLQD